MVIALVVSYDDGDFAVHYAKGRTLEEAQRWCNQRKQALAAQGTACASAVLNPEHLQWIADCNVGESASG
jgi:hypothetical protein